MGLIKMLKVFLRYFIFHNINYNSGKILGKRIREACEELGPIFIKFGQMLSTKYDILSKEDCLELQNLFDDINPISYEKVCEIFLHDFGQSPEEMYEEFDKIPIASASIAQVYRARLKTGEDVAVKVRRPYVGKNIIRDMNSLINFVRFFEFFSPSLRFVGGVEIAKEMKRWLLEEIDFENEIKNMIDLKICYNFCDGKQYRKDLPCLRLLFPYRDFCSKNIITMNFLDGVPLSKIHLVKNNLDYNPELSLDSYLNASTHAFFHNKGAYLFQADPHPANILILKHGEVASIDCGLIERISQKDIEKTTRLFLAVYSGDVENVVRSMLKVCDVDCFKYAGRIRGDVKEFLKRTPYEGIGFWFMGIVKILVKHRIPVPRFLNAFGRCNFILDGALKSFNSSKTTLDYLEKELKYSLRRKMMRNILDIKYEGFLYNLSEKIRDSPEVANQILNDLYVKFRRVF
jgi:ubiquinone biosynthesis protein